MELSRGTPIMPVSLPEAPTKEKGASTGAPTGCGLPSSEPLPRMVGSEWSWSSATARLICMRASSSSATRRSSLLSASHLAECGSCSSGSWSATGTTRGWRAAKTGSSASKRSCCWSLSKRRCPSSSRRFEAMGSRACRGQRACRQTESSRPGANTRTDSCAGNGSHTHWRSSVQARGSLTRDCLLYTTPAKHGHVSVRAVLAPCSREERAGALRVASQWRRHDPCGTRKRAHHR